MTLTFKILAPQLRCLSLRFERVARSGCSFFENAFSAGFWYKRFWYHVYQAAEAALGAQYLLFSFF